MASLTVAEYKPLVCAKCGGAGRVSAFQHIKGGECFRCGGSGTDPVMVEAERQLTDDEVLAALARAGMPVAFPEREVNSLDDLFLSDDEVANHKQLMAGARIALAHL
jgi:hypothetical protein